MAKLVLWLAFVCFLLGCKADFYDDLELPSREDTTDGEIKKSFRKLSRQWHPDVNPGNEYAREQYQKINRANEVLSDKKLRKVFDISGEEGLKQYEDQKKQGGGGGGRSLFDFFGGQQQGTKRGHNVKMALQVGLEDIYNGETLTIKLQKQKLCPGCKGSGAASKADVGKCKHCKGKGVTLQQVQLAPGFVQQIQNTCPHCGGTGKHVKKKCPICNGKKVTRGETPLEVTIDRGAPEGHEITFEMEGDQNPDVLPGDVILQLKTKPHAMFRREGNDLHMTMRISLLESLIGFTKQIVHMDGHKVTIAKQGVTPPGFKKTMAEEGMPLHDVPSEKGQLIITFEIDFPTSLSSSQQDLARKMLS